MTASKLGMLVFKVAVTAALLWFLFDRVDLRPVADKLQTISPPWALAAIAILTAQLLLTGVRWHRVGLLIDVDISLRQALPLALIGQLFNQVLPSSVGGDGVRAWLLSRSGIAMARAIMSILCDRLVALIVLTGLVALSLPFLRALTTEQIPSIRLLSMAIPALTLLGVLVLFCGGALVNWLMRFRLTKPVGALMRDLRKVLLSSGSMPIVGLTLLVQTLVVLAVYLCARALDTQLSAVHVLMLPLILLISMVPISFAGWGVRETAMIIGLGSVGIEAHSALAISVAFGLAQIAISLPGVALVILNRKSGPALPKTDAGGELPP